MKQSKRDLINSINNKRINMNKATLNSLNARFIEDKVLDNKKISETEYKVEYSKSGYFIAEIPGQLISCRLKPTKNPNSYYLYVGNIYPDEYELNKLESSGLIWSDAQKDREADYALKTWANLTPDEEDLLAYKLEVYSFVDKKTAEFLKTRNKNHKILIVGRYDFSDAEYNAQGPSRRRKSSNFQNTFWDKITINVKTPRFLLINEEIGKGGHTFINFIDINKTIAKSTFKLECEKIAQAYQIFIENIDENNFNCDFSNNMNYNIKYGYSNLSFNKEKIPVTDYAHVIATSLNEYSHLLKDNTKKFYQIQIPKNSEEGIVISSSSLESRKNPKIFRKIETEDSVFYNEYVGPIYAILNNNIQKYYLTANGPAVKPNDYRTKAERIAAPMKNLDATNHIFATLYDIKKAKEQGENLYLSGKKVVTGSFFIDKNFQK